MGILVGLGVIGGLLGFFVYMGRARCPKCGNWWAWNVYGGTKFVTSECKRCKTRFTWHVEDGRVTNTRSMSCQVGRRSP